MADVKVISVNPSDQTLGAINTAKLESIARSLRMNEASFSLPGLKAICQFIFGVNPTAKKIASSKPAIVRIVMAGLFVLSASFTMGGAFFALALIFSGMIAIGFFDRIASFSGFALLIGLIISSFGGSPMETYEIILFTVMAAGLLAVSIIGPGAWSIDKFMSRALYSKVKTGIARHREERALRDAEIRLSYKAWSNLM